MLEKQTNPSSLLPNSQSISRPDLIRFVGFFFDPYLLVTTHPAKRTQAVILLLNGMQQMFTHQIISRFDPFHPRLQLVDL